ncbi:MAG: ABC transporter substrate-binding protein [Thermomicrobiales bacterium]
MPVMLDLSETEALLTAAEIERLVAAISRRRVLICAGGAALLAAAPMGVRGQEATPAAMRQVEDHFGPVTIPAHPQRVIVEGNSTLGNVIALGVKPLAASMNPNSLPVFLEGKIDGVVDVLDLSSGTDSIDIEKALSLDPDLIIAISGSGGQDWNLENVERYKAALPATYAYEQSYTYEEEIKQNLIDAAIALNVEDRAQAVLDAYDARVAELREAVTAAGFTDKPVTVVRIFQGGTIWIPYGTSESIVFRAVGIPQPEGQRNPDDFGMELSLERLDVLNEAYALVIYIDDNAEMTQQQLLNNPVWQAVTPVREGRVIFVNSGVWNSMEIPGVMAIMDDVENLLLPLADKA